jgi:UDP-N-acetylmuramyl tripeptide synthase
MFTLFSIFAKLTRVFFKTLNLGQGTTLISNLYLKFFPKSLDFSGFSFTKGVIFITGTNGKTSTSKLLADFLNYLGYRVLHNETGGNILRSILGLFLLKNGEVSKNEYDFLVLEVDEASVFELSKYFKVDVLILLNFSRDQLDRYFEIENISDNLISLLKSNPEINLVYNEEDPYCSEVAGQVKNTKLSFKKNLDLLKISNVREEYLAYNLDAVVKTLSGYGYYPKDYLTALRSIKKPYGRGEEILYQGIKFKLHLAKNPNSFNNNLIELHKRKGFDNLLFCLNDETPDGRDISWIYDIEPYLIYEASNAKNLYFSGHRAFEMAQRVSIAIEDSKKIIVEVKLAEILNKIVKSKASEVEVLCNYSSMLQIRKILTGKNIL